MSNMKQIRATSCEIGSDCHLARFRSIISCLSILPVFLIIDCLVLNVLFGPWLYISVNFWIHEDVLTLPFETVLYTDGSEGSC